MNKAQREKIELEMLRELERWLRENYPPGIDSALANLAIWRRNNLQRDQKRRLRRKNDNDS